MEQIDPIHKKSLTVGKSKTEAGTGRVIPLNETAIAAMEAHAGWYTGGSGSAGPSGLYLHFGTPLPKDPTRPIASFKTAWIKAREKAGVKARWHDDRHTLVTECAESGAGDEVIMSIAGTFRGTCFPATRTYEWKRSGVPSTKSPHASARRDQAAAASPFVLVQ